MVPDLSRAHTVGAPSVLNSWAPYSVVSPLTGLDHVKETVEAPAVVTGPYQISSSVVPDPANCTPIVHVVTPPPETDDTVGVAESTSAYATSTSPTAWGLSDSAVTPGPAAVEKAPTASREKSNWSAGRSGLDVPEPVVTLMSTGPGASLGEAAVSEESLSTVKAVAATAPNRTWVAPVKLVPVTVTDVPPELGPEAGLTAVTVGGGPVLNVNQSAGALTAEVPPEVVTVTSTVPVDAGSGR